MRFESAASQPTAVGSFAGGSCSTCACGMSRSGSRIAPELTKPSVSGFGAHIAPSLKPKEIIPPSRSRWAQLADGGSQRSSSVQTLANWSAPRTPCSSDLACYQMEPSNFAPAVASAAHNIQHLVPHLNEGVTSDGLQARTCPSSQAVRSPVNRFMPQTTKLASRSSGLSSSSTTPRLTPHQKKGLTTADLHVKCADAKILYMHYKEHGFPPPPWPKVTPPSLMVEKIEEGRTPVVGSSSWRRDGGTLPTSMNKLINIGAGGVLNVSEDQAQMCAAVYCNNSAPELFAHWKLTPIPLKDVMMRLPSILAHRRRAAQAQLDAFTTGSIHFLPGSWNLDAVDGNVMVLRGLVAFLKEVRISQPLCIIASQYAADDHNPQRVLDSATNRAFADDFPDAPPPLTNAAYATARVLALRQTLNKFGVGDELALYVIDSPRGSSPRLHKEISMTLSPPTTEGARWVGGVKTAADDDQGLELCDSVYSLSNDHWFEPSADEGETATQLSLSGRRLPTPADGPLASTSLLNS